MAAAASPLHLVGLCWNPLRYDPRLRRAIQLEHARTNDRQLDTQRHDGNQDGTNTDGSQSGTERAVNTHQ